MNIFHHLSVKWKIYLIAIVSILGFGAYLGFNVWVNSNNAKLLTGLRTTYLPILEKASENDVRLDRLSELLNNAVMTGELDFIETAQQSADDMIARFDDIHQLEPERKQAVEEIKNSFIDFFSQAKAISTDLANGDADPKELRLRAEKKEAAFNRLDSQLAAFVTYAHDKFSGSIDTANQNSETMLTSGFVIWAVCILLMAVTVYTIARIILGSINQVSTSLNEIAKGSADFSKKITVGSGDEIGRLAMSFNALMENLRIKTNDLMSMMQNMHTGLFTITQDETIHREYSAFIEDIFETQDVAGQNYNALLFNHSSLGSDALNQVSAAVTSLLGADEMMYDFNQHLLVKEFTITLVASGQQAHEKILELDWDPIINDGIITKLMVTVRDVTELRSMQAAAEEQKRELEMIGQILRITPTKFSQFSENALHLLDQNEAIIQRQSDKDLAVVATLFANMHTIKGNARTYQLAFITDVVHEAESVYDRLRKEPETIWNPHQLLDDLQQVRESLLRYRKVQSEKLAFDESKSGVPQNGIVIQKSTYQTLLKTCEALTQDNHASSPVALVNLVRGLDAIPFPLVLDGLLTSLPEVANQLGKPAPTIAIDDQALAIYGAHSSMIINVFSHLLKNALDHGLEMPEERLAKGKTEQGAVNIAAEYQNEQATLTLSDDGRGLNLKRLLLKISEQPTLLNGATLTAQTVAESIFLSGMSTADQVTDISGRGVGMDAVKKYLNAVGCDIRIVLSPDARLDDEFAPFKLIVTLGAGIFHPLSSASAINAAA